VLSTVSECYEKVVIPRHSIPQPNLSNVMKGIGPPGAIASMACSAGGGTIPAEGVPRHPLGRLDVARAPHPTPPSFRHDCMQNEARHRGC
jgi:hypothetical protein